MKGDNEPMLDLVGNDIGVSRHLSKALKILADSPGIDKDLQKQLREIMNGQGSLRDLARSESFTRYSEAAMSKIVADTASRTPEEIQRLAGAGERILDTYRNEVPDVSSAASSAPETAALESKSSPAAVTLADPTAHRGDPRVTRNVIPGTRKPDRDRIVAPDEPDDDDLYYRDRRQRGWLE
ncbi:hypothetical protein ACQPW1_08930 [Nocardia sp. CA-128927]|uniref:hypothetical protein n=1 Tax=Nocardia sp. CA-128927 TaxID=3239975 RepID=UPI003D998F05